jgi:hypothetical protein
MITIAEMNGQGPDRLDPMAMLVSSSSVALLADVSRSTVSSWRNPTRKRGFPEPAGGSGDRPLFTLLSVVEWLARNGYWDEGRFLRLIPGVILSQLAESLEVVPDGRRDTGMQLLETACLAKMALLSGYQPPRTEDQTEQIRDLRAAGKNAAATKPEWGILVAAAEDGIDTLKSDRPGLADDVSELVQFANLMLVWAASSTSQVDKIGRRIVAEFFQPRVTYPITVGGQTYRDASWSETHHSVEWGTPTGPGKAARDAVGDAHAAVLLARQSPRPSAGQRGKDRGLLTVVDPCAGIGSDLLAMADNVRPKTNGSGSQPPMRFIGFESDEDRLMIARRRAFLADLQIEFHHADLLADDRMAGLDADLIVAVSRPAVEGAGYDYEASIKPHDSRWIYGIPEGGLAWIMHAVNHLAPDGRAVVRTPPEMTRTGGNSLILRGLVGNGWVETISLGPKEDLWTLSHEPDRPSVKVSQRSAAGKTASMEIQTSWLMQHWPADLRTLLLDQIERDPQQIWIQLHDAAGRVKGAAEDLITPLNLVEGNITGMQRLAENRQPASPASTSGTSGPANVLSLGELAKAGYLEILSPKQWRPATAGTDEESGTTVEMRDTDVIVQLDDGRRKERSWVMHEEGERICAQRWTPSIVWTPKSFVLRVRNIEELNPAYLACALTGSWNERIRSDQSKPRLVDRLKAFEVPMLTPSDQEEAQDAIVSIQILRNHAELLATRAQKLETSFLNAIRYGAVSPHKTNTDEKGHADV